MAAHCPPARPRKSRREQRPHSLRISLSADLRFYPQGTCLCVYAACGVFPTHTHDLSLSDYSLNLSKLPWSSTQGPVTGADSPTHLLAWQGDSNGVRQLNGPRELLEQKESVEMAVKGGGLGGPIQGWGIRGAPELLPPIHSAGGGANKDPSQDAGEETTPDTKPSGSSLQAQVASGSPQKAQHAPNSFSAGHGRAWHSGLVSVRLAENKRVTRSWNGACRRSPRPCFGGSSLPSDPWRWVWCRGCLSV